MRILLSIKAVLNYLYNHLIDLVWTKKIRFADGTEMTTVPKGNNLYDIKLLSQAIADKGFAFMCHTNKRVLQKANIPTLYADIKNKYNNCDASVSGNADYTHNSITYDVATQKCVWKNSGSDIYVSDNLDLSNPQSITLTELYNDNQSVRTIICGENINVIFGHFDNTCYIHDKSWNFIKKYDLNAYGEYKIFYKAIEDYIILCFYDNYNSKTYIIKINDNTTADYETTPNLYVEGEYHHLEPYRISKVYNGYLYISCLRYTKVSLLKLNINDFTQYTEYETNIDDGSILTQVGSTSINMTELVIVDNTYYIGAGENVYKSTNLTDWSMIFNIGTYCYCLYDLGTTFYLVTNGTIYKTTDFINFTGVKIFNVSSYNYQFYFFYADNTTLVCSMTYPDCYIYGGLVKTVLTDKYSINGSVININYYKYNDFKICLSDGGTNDTNLETVFNYLGYLNYWLIDLTNETVCIQRDKNTYSAMFVGDNFVDDLEDLPTNNYSKLVMEQELQTLKNNVDFEIITSGNNWAKKYSNGWLEQGGQTVCNSNTNLLVNYKDTNYTVVGTIYNNGADQSIAVFNKTTNKFNFGSENDVPILWVSYGWWK